jgi:Flp pilus assembly protein TadD
MNRVTLCFPALFVAFLLGAGCSSEKHTPNPMLKAGAQDTDLARHENALAYELLQQGNYDKAQEHLVLALAADPLFGPAHNNRGLVYYHTGRLYLAAWEFENAIKLMPYQSEPRNNLGLVFESAGKLSDATEAYAKAREMEPDNPQYIGNLARARVRRGDRDTQTRQLLEELALKDDRPEWVEWARLKLLKLRAADGSTTTRKDDSN